MSASEAVLARALAALLAAPRGATITRRRTDAYAFDELPAIEIQRKAGSSEAHGDRADRWRMNFEIVLLVADSSMAETALDALWEQADSTLHADSQLAVLGRGLRCTNTSEPEQVPIEEGVAARMVCTYEIQILTRRGDLSHAMT